MTSKITTFPSYLKGTNTIKGSFPVYVNYSVDENGIDICNVQQSITDDRNQIQQALEETKNIGLITQNSDSIDTFVYVINDGTNTTKFIEI
jgi:hypothetical protein